MMNQRSSLVADATAASGSAVVLMGLAESFEVPRAAEAGMAMGGQHQIRVRGQCIFSSSNGVVRTK